MKKPTPEEYGISFEDVERATQLSQKIETRFSVAIALLTGLAIALGFWAMFSPFSSVEAEAVVLFIILGVIIYGMVARLGGKVFAKRIAAIVVGNHPLFSAVVRFTSDLEDYEAWWIRTQTSFWQSLSGHQFEQELAELFSNSGYKASLTPISGDAGVDIELWKDGFVTIVQCKAHKNPIGPATARELYGTLTAHKAKEAILASVSGFTSGVKPYIKGKRIELMDLPVIMSMQRKLNITHHRSNLGSTVSNKQLRYHRKN